MKKHRQIEITAFRRRVTFASGQLQCEKEKLRLNHADSSETINIDSAEGQEILSETVRLLEKGLGKTNTEGDL